MDEDVVKITVPAAPSAPYGTESCWATLVAPDRWRVDNVLFFTDGISRGDVVRCEVAGDGTLVAVELLERSDEVTVVLFSDDPAQLVTLVTDLHRGRPAGRLTAEGMHEGAQAIQYPLEDEEAVWDELHDLVSRHVGVPAVLDAEEQTLGPLGYAVVAHPHWDAPEPIAGADQVLADRPAPELVAIDWPQPDDRVAAGWPASYVEDLRASAMDDERLRGLLLDRLYLQVVTLDLRGAVIREEGMAKAGRQRWPLGGPGDDEARTAWLDAHEDGRVRYCVDDELDATVRDRIAALGLDPDGDPYAPTR